jgi:hypothetical protein
MLELGLAEKAKIEPTGMRRQVEVFAKSKFLWLQRCNF